MNKGSKIAMGIGIALVIAIFTGFGADYVGGYFRDKCGYSLGGFCYNLQVKEPNTVNPCDYTTQEDCDADTLCSWESYHTYSEECQQSKQNAFAIFATIIGVITLTAGFMVKNNSSLSGGLVGGGIISLIIAVISYWSKLDELFRVVLIGLLAIVLMVLAYKKLKD